MKRPSAFVLVFLPSLVPRRGEQSDLITYKGATVQAEGLNFFFSSKNGYLNFVVIVEGFFFFLGGGGEGSKSVLKKTFHYSLIASKAPRCAKRRNLSQFLL